MKLCNRIASVFLASLLLIEQLPAQAPGSSGPLDLQLHLVESEGGVSAVAGSHSVNGLTVQVTDASGTPTPDAAVVLRLPDEGATGKFSDGSHAAIAYTDASGRAYLRDIQWSSTAGVVSMKLTATKGTIHAGMLIEKTLTAASVVSSGAATPASVPATSIQPKLPPDPEASKPTPVAAKIQAPPAAPVAEAQAVVTVRQPGAVDRSSRGPVPASASPSFLEPAVSVTNGPAQQQVHSGSHKKWIILAVVIAAGAGAGIAMAGKGKSSSASTSSSSSLSIGSPTVSVGHP